MNDGRKRDIRLKAQAFRDRCMVSGYGIVDLFRECERAGYRLIRYPLGEQGDLGFAVRREEDIIIFTNSSSRLAREWFTLAHEIGHAVLHLAEGCSFVETDATLTGTVSDEREQEANYFAACLLLPKNELDRYCELEIEENTRFTAMDIARLMSAFHVSFETALNRLENIGRIDAQERLRIGNQKNEQRVGKLLQSVGGNGRLNRPSEEVSIPAEFLDYVIYNYNHNAIPEETLEKALQYCGLTMEDIGDKLTEREGEIW